MTGDLYSESVPESYPAERWVNVTDQIQKIFRANGYDAAPEEIDHEVELRGHSLHVTFNEPPLWVQEGDDD